MRQLMMVPMLCGLMLLATAAMPSVLLAEEAPAPRVTGDFGKLDLAPETARQVAALQAELKAKLAELNDAYEAKILAVLPEENKKALDALREEALEKRRAYARERYQKMKEARDAAAAAAAKDKAAE